MSWTKYFPPRVTADTWPLLLFDVERDEAVDQVFTPARFAEVPWWENQSFRVTWTFDSPAENAYNYFHVRLFFPVQMSVRLRSEWTAGGYVYAELWNPETLFSFPFTWGHSIVTVPPNFPKVIPGSAEETAEYGPGLFVAKFHSIVDAGTTGEHVAEIEWSPATP